MFFFATRDIDDGFYENTGLLVNKFPVTYTAGRRKETEDGFEAKPATELLIRNKVEKGAYASLFIHRLFLQI
jgi:hypothetical protein